MNLPSIKKIQYIVYYLNNYITFVINFLMMKKEYSKVGILIGENAELEALALNALGALRGELPVQVYR